MIRIEILKKSKSWYWRMKARNGRILAHSETYSSKQKAEKSAKIVSNNEKWEVLNGS